MFFILGILLIFHILIFAQILPYDMIWAGKLNSVEEMKKFETVSLLVNSFILIILIIKFKLIEKAKDNWVIDFFIWVFVVFFAFNTIGNLFAKNKYELIIGGLLTLTCSFLCYKIVQKPVNSSEKRPLEGQ